MSISFIWEDDVVGEVRKRNTADDGLTAVHAYQELVRNAGSGVGIQLGIKNITELLERYCSRLDACVICGQPGLDSPATQMAPWTPPGVIPEFRILSKP